MPKIKFRPFIGKNYQKQDFKILILGESAYFWDEDLVEQFFTGNTQPLEDITVRSVGEFLDYKKGLQPHCRWMNTFTKFANAMSNRLLSAEECVAFWESIVFYNFVQVPMPKPRVSPTPEQFADSKEPFLEILKIYQPDFIVLWGHRLWDNFDKTNYAKIEGIHYLNYDKKYPIFVAPHPSSTAISKKELWQELEQYIRKTQG